MSQYDYLEERRQNARIWLPPRLCGELYDHNSFWSVFFADLESAVEEITIVCPFVNTRSVNRILPYLEIALRKGVKVNVFIRWKLERATDAVEGIKLLADEGLEVVSRISIHHKKAIIDRKIAWEGSLNILAHKDTQEHMRRFEYECVANELQELIDKVRCVRKIS